MAGIWQQMTLQPSSFPRSFSEVPALGSLSPDPSWSVKGRDRALRGVGVAAEIKQRQAGQLWSWVASTGGFAGDPRVTSDEAFSMQNRMEPGAPPWDVCVCKTHQPLAVLLRMSCSSCELEGHMI